MKESVVRKGSKDHDELSCVGQDWQLSHISKGERTVRNGPVALCICSLTFFASLMRTRAVKIWKRVFIVLEARLGL